jgi:hypothetical protein
MSSDWRAFSQEAGFSVEDHTISLNLTQDRRQKIYVEDDREDGYCRIWSVAAGMSVLRKIERKPEYFAWRRNHLSNLAGFKIDRKGRLIGEAWVPTAGLDAEEWAIYVKSLAQSCDRIEYLLTGKDQQ